MRLSGCSARAATRLGCCGIVEITGSTLHRWRRAHAGASAADARRLKESQAQNARLKKLLAEAELDKATPKESADRGAGDPGPSPGRG